MAFGSNNSVVTEFIIDTSKGVDDLKGLASQVRSYEKQLRDVETINRQLDRQWANQHPTLSAIGNAYKSLTGNMSLSVMAGNLLSKGLLGVAGSVIQTIKEVGEYNKAISVAGKEMEALRGQVDGVSVFEIAAAKSKQLGSGINLTTKEFVELSRNADKLGDALGIEFSSSINLVTDAIARQSDRSLKQIGITVDFETAIKSYAFEHKKMLAQISEEERQQIVIEKTLEAVKRRASELNDENTSLTEGVENLSKAWESYLLPALNKVNVAIGGVLKSFSDIENWEVPWIDSAVRFMAGLPSLEEMRVGRLATTEEKAIDQFYSNLEKKENAYVSKLNVQWDSELAKINAKEQDAKEKARSAKTHRVKEKIDELNLISDLEKKYQENIERGRKQGIQGRSESVEISAREKFESDSQSPFSGFTDIERNKVVYLSAINEINEGIEKQNEALRALNDQWKETADQLQNAGVGALANITAGLWAAADAAIVSGESFGAAFGKMVKATLLGVAQQATVKAIFEMAEGFAALAMMNIPSAKLHFLSAAMFGGVAAVSGGAALGMSAAGVGAGQSNMAQGTGAGGSSAGGGQVYSPSFKTSSAKEKESTFYFNVYVGDPNNPSSSLVMTKQITAKAAKEAA